MKRTAATNKAVGQLSTNPEHTEQSWWTPDKAPRPQPIIARSHLPPPPPVPMPKPPQYQTSRVPHPLASSNRPLSTMVQGSRAHVRELWGQSLKTDSSSDPAAPLDGEKEQHEDRWASYAKASSPLKSSFSAPLLDVFEATLKGLKLEGQWQPEESKTTSQVTVKDASDNNECEADRDLISLGSSQETGQRIDQPSLDRAEAEPKHVLDSEDTNEKLISEEGAAAGIRAVEEPIEDGNAALCFQIMKEASENAEWLRRDRDWYRNELIKITGNLYHERPTSPPHRASIWEEKVVDKSKLDAENKESMATQLRDYRTKIVAHQESLRMQKSTSDASSASSSTSAIAPVEPVLKSIDHTTTPPWEKTTGAKRTHDLLIEYGIDPKGLSRSLFDSFALLPTFEAQRKSVEAYATNIGQYSRKDPGYPNMLIKGHAVPEQLQMRAVGPNNSILGQHSFGFPPPPTLPMPPMPPTPMITMPYMPPGMTTFPRKALPPPPHPHPSHINVPKRDMLPPQMIQHRMMIQQQAAHYAAAQRAAQQAAQMAAQQLPPRNIWGHSPLPVGPSSGNSALQDYQVQLMVLEQQNKKRLLLARNEFGPASEAKSDEEINADTTDPSSQLPSSQTEEDAESSRQISEKDVESSVEPHIIHTDARGDRRSQMFGHGLNALRNGVIVAAEEARRVGIQVGNEAKKAAAETYRETLKAGTEVHKAVFNTHPRSPPLVPEVSENLNYKIMQTIAQAESTLGDEFKRAIPSPDFMCLQSQPPIEVVGASRPSNDVIEAGPVSPLVKETNLTSGTSMNRKP
jgi:hypothetical protein